MIMGKSLVKSSVASKLCLIPNDVQSACVASPGAHAAVVITGTLLGRLPLTTSLTKAPISSNWGRKLVKPQVHIRCASSTGNRMRKSCHWWYNTIQPTQDVRDQGKWYSTIYKGRLITTYLERANGGVVRVSNIGSKCLFVARSTVLA